MSQVLVTNHPERIGRLVLTNCDTHENFPPGIFKAMPPLAKLPGGMPVLSRPVPHPRRRPPRLRPLRPHARSPPTWSPPGCARRWRTAAIMHDLKKVTAGMNKRHTLAAAEKLRGSELPIRLLWAPGDKLLPDQVRRTAGRRSPQRRDRPDPERQNLRPLDQPQRVADEIADFVGSRRCVEGWVSLSRPGFLASKYGRLSLSGLCEEQDAGPERDTHSLATAQSWP